MAEHDDPGCRELAECGWFAPLISTSSPAAIRRKSAIKVSERSLASGGSNRSLSIRSSASRSSSSLARARQGYEAETLREEDARANALPAIAEATGEADTIFPGVFPRTLEL